MKWGKIIKWLIIIALLLGAGYFLIKAPLIAIPIYLLGFLIWMIHKAHIKYEAGRHRTGEYI